MAQLVVSAVGAAVGFVIGGPAGAQIGWVAGSMVGAYAFAENQTHEGPRLKDLKITGADYGDAIPWVAGSPRIAGQIIWASNRRETRHEEEVGGKGGGGGATQVTYTYDCDLLILLTENPYGGVSRVWSNNELVWTGKSMKSGVWRGMTVYAGNPSQLPDTVYEAAVGVGNAPAMRGCTTVLIQGLQLGGSGNIPNLTFEIGEGTNAWNITCIAVIDEDDGSTTQAQVNARWAAFREAWPKRKFHLLVPFYGEVGGGTGGGSGSLGSPVKVAPETVNDPLFHGPVLMNRDNGNPARAEDWYEMCGLDRVPNHAHIALFIDTSGSMTMATVQASYDLFMSKLAARGIQIVTVYNGNEDYITPFNAFMDVEGSNNTATASLRYLTQDLMQRAGYAEIDYETAALSALTKPVRALALSQVSSTRSALEVLQKCWHFECSATDKLRLRPRSTTPVARIQFVDLGFGSSAGGLDDPLAIRMGNDLEMPAQIALTYPNMAGDYNADSQFSDRLISGQQSTQTMQVPVGMLPAEAKGVADALLMDAVAGLQSTTLSVPLKYAFVEPGDVVEAVAQDGRIYRLRVQTRKDQGIWLELECKLDDVGALDSAAITDEGYITVQDPASVPDTILLALDVPLLRDADDQPGFYLAAAPDSINVATDQWKGADVASSWDDIDYASLLSILEAATVGEALTVLPAWNGGPVFDEASVLRVQMLGQLSSTNRGAMLLDEAVNALLVGDEVVRFRNAELVDADEDRGRYTYQLTGFIRGFRGTEWAMGGHTAGERCVLLNRGVRRVNTQLNELQVQRWLKATTVGKYITDVQPQAFTNTGRALKPFAPVGLRALTQEGVGVHLSWQRRTRLSYRYGGESPSVPLGEALERYRVQVFADDLLLRTEIVTQPSYDYTTTLTAADGLSAGDPVRFEVCQLSESVGAGYITTKEGFAA
ncbi:phage tail protein [Comamonas aquatica]|uniref:phage tail protein n=1 Tax=Comamonas aquatica TaxID=225991 RepID=UPI00244B6639|nr:phage tail protein [Comamonas aquatica]MDH0494142.1 phage tail protein [Comamonas aquatica]